MTTENRRSFSGIKCGKRSSVSILYGHNYYKIKDHEKICFIECAPAYLFILLSGVFCFNIDER